MKLRRFCCCAALAVAASFFWLAPPVDAWGIKAHQWIHHRAIDNLPQPVRSYFERHRAFLVEHSTAADERRKSDPEEAPRHFIDIDAYGSFPFKEFSLSRAELVARVGEKKVRDSGLVLWTIEETYARLRDGMRQFDPGWISGAADLGHYSSDLHQPFHAVLNYNGQLTGQHGIHFRFEEEMINRNLDKLGFDASPAVLEQKKPLELAFDIALESYALADNVLVAEYRIVRDLKLNRATLPRDAKNFPIYPDAYYERMWKATSWIVQKRMNQSAARLANLWYSAWVEAGKPNLDVRNRER